MHDTHYIPDQIEISKFSSMHWTDLALVVYFDDILKYSTLLSCHSFHLNCNDKGKLLWQQKTVN
jgi:hypothetical protein